MDLKYSVYKLVYSKDPTVGLNTVASKALLATGTLL